ncbi:MAG: hypothetical protein WCX73_01280 [Candidatus Pacearchaeota archaeon]|jgi:hypothetical protein
MTRKINPFNPGILHLKIIPLNNNIRAAVTKVYYTYTQTKKDPCIEEINEYTERIEHPKSFPRDFSLACKEEYLVLNPDNTYSITDKGKNLLGTQGFQSIPRGSSRMKYIKERITEKNKRSRTLVHKVC